MRTLLILILIGISNLSYGQRNADAESLVEEGVNYHDKGDYEGAIAKYDKALALDKDNLLALAEKAYSLVSLQKYEEAVACCQRAISTHPGDKGLRTVYVTYGNALDGLKKTDKSIEIYDEGILLFPDFYQLYFNKGITLFSVKNYDEAMVNFQKAVMLNPKHASSHNAIARLSKINNKRIPSILAYCRFLVIEPQSKRANENLLSLQALMKGNVEVTGKKSITINISADIFADTNANGKPKANSFSSTELILSMDAALDLDKKNKKKSDVEQFIRKLETLCASLAQSKKDNYGFFWDYYVPYFVEMKEKKFLETFAYIAFASSEDPHVMKWLKSHKSETDQFFEWTKSFEWKTNE